MGIIRRHRYKEFVKSVWPEAHCVMVVVLDRYLDHNGEMTEREYVEYNVFLREHSSVFSFGASPVSAWRNAWWCIKDRKKVEPNA